VERKVSAGQQRTLVLGLGNPLLTDDRVGLEVVSESEDRLARSSSSVEMRRSFAAACG